MSNSCVKHPMTFGTQICSECGHHFCVECVVFPFGLKKPPVCISCALELSGVSARPTGRPKLSRQSIRERRSAQRKAQKAKSTAAGTDEVPEHFDDAADGETEQSGTGEHIGVGAWIDDSESIDNVPGGWSQTYR